MDTRTKNSIFNFIKKNDTKSLQEVLLDGIDLNQTKKSLTPIEYAAQLQHWECVKLIALSKQAIKINDGFSVNARYGSALLYAIEAEDIEIIELLIKQKASLVWTKTNSKNGLLHVAVEKNNKTIIQILLENNVDLLHKNKDGLNAFNYALELGQKTENWSTLDYLLQQVTAEKNKNDQLELGKILCNASYFRKHNIAERALKLGAKFTWHHTVSRNGCVHFAVQNNDLKMLKIFNTYQSNLNLALNVDRETPFILALKLHHWDCAEFLMPKQAFTPELLTQISPYFLDAIKDQHHRIIQVLIKKNISVNELTDDRETGLHLAAKNNDVKSINILLNTPIDKKMANKSELTAIELACSLSHWDAAQEIIEHDLRSKSTLTEAYLSEMHYTEALYLSIQKGNYAIVKLLLDLGVNCQKENSTMGNIALYWTFMTDNKNILNLLLKRIDLKKVSPNKDNKGPAEIAGEFSANSCIEELNNFLNYSNMCAQRNEVCVQYLKDLQLLLNSTSFKIKLFFGWTTGTPTHITTIKNKLAQIDYNNFEKVWALINQIAIIFTASLNHENSHETTKQFDQQRLFELQQILQFGSQINLQLKFDTSILRTSPILNTQLQYFYTTPVVVSNLTSTTQIDPPPSYELATQSNKLTKTLYPKVADLSLFPKKNDTNDHGLTQSLDPGPSRGTTEKSLVPFLA